MAFSKKQAEWFDNAGHRWNFKTGAVRSGKTFADYYTIPKRIRARVGKPGLAFIFGVSKSTIERNILEPMRSIWGDQIVGSIRSDNTAQLFGETVYCLGCEKVSQVAKIRGASIKYAYGDEVAEWNPEVFDLIKSRLDKPYSCFDGALNPESPNHWLKGFLDSDADIYEQHYTIFDNPFLPQEFVDNLCKEYQGTVYYDRYIRGLWALAEGLIYPMYQQVVINTIPQEKPLKTAFSVDYGTMNAFACLQWNLYGNKWIAVQGYYYSGRETGVQKTDAEYLQDIERRFSDAITYVKENRMKTVLHEKLEVIIDPSAASFIALLHKTDWAKVHKADNDVLNGIRETATAMNLQLFGVYEGVKEFAQEAGGYVWDDRSLEERPVKENDHCLTGDTLVFTVNGKKRIDELVGKSGYVLSYNTKRGKAEYKRFYSVRMTQKAAKVYKITTENGDVVRCTADHPVLTKRGYVCAGNLRNGDEILYITDAMRYNKRKTPKRRLLAWLSTRMMDWLRMLMV